MFYKDKHCITSNAYTKPQNENNFIVFTFVTHINLMLKDSLIKIKIIGLLQLSWYQPKYVELEVKVINAIILRILYGEFL